LQGDVGRILSIKDSVVLIEGLNNVKLNELVEFKIKRLKSQGPLLGVALNLEYNVVKALTFGNEKILRPGILVKRTHQVVSVLVHNNVLGRVIDPLGRALDGQGPILTAAQKRKLGAGVVRNIEIKAPGVIERKSVRESLETGIKMIDSLVPIGRGQRELIIGDKKNRKNNYCY